MLSLFKKWVRSSLLPLSATLMLLFLCHNGIEAHTINYQLDEVSDSEIFQTYVVQGFKHIIPLGLDHILFVLCIFFLNTDLKKVVWQATLFTLAHSVTLALSVYNVIDVPGSLIEPIIALSIAVLAIENMFSTQVKPWRMVLIFLFGLIHGMGFASALNDLGMPRYAFSQALISFNVGVELGQLAVILLTYLAVLPILHNKIFYKKWVVVPACCFIALLSFYWTLERLSIL